jgi:N-acetylneuraminic acid mutarotase
MKEEHSIESKTKQTGLVYETEENKTTTRYTPLTRQDFDISVIDNWIEVKTKSTPRRRCNHLSFIYDNQLYVIGGRDINKGKIDECHYINLNSLKQLDDMQWNKIYSNELEALSNNAGDVVGNCYYLFGGENKNGKAVNSIYSYNIDEDRWEKISFSVKEIPPMIGHTCNYYGPSGLFIVFGGFYNAKYSNDIFTYHDKKWIKLNTISVAPIGRIYHTSTLIDDCLYVYSGETMDGVYLNDLWKYNIRNNSWEEILPVGEVPKPRTGHTCVHYNGYLYIFGGKIANIQERNEFWKYDIKKNAFELIHDTLIDQTSYETIENASKKSNKN